MFLAKDLFEKIYSEKVEKLTSKFSDNLSNHEGYEKKPSFATISSISTKPKEAPVSMTASSCDFKVGDKIEHKKFGVGDVTEISTLSGGGTGLTINFNDFGEKKFVCNEIVLKLIKKL